jgi:hypothetical protein
MLVRCYLSFFSLSKVICLAKRVDKATFASIVTPYDTDSVLPVVNEIKSNMKSLITRYVPDISKLPLHQGMTWDPTWKALPTHHLTQDLLCQWLNPGYAKKIKSSFVSLAWEIPAFQFLMNLVHAGGEQWSQGRLWPTRVRYAFDKLNKTFTGLDLDKFEHDVGRYLPTCDQLGIPPICGRLGCSIEGGGKRRIFAIGNYVNQRLLRPVHEWLASVLKRIPMDGTFNQVAPLDRLIGNNHCYSFDLKSATDRWPLVFLFEVMQCLFDRSFAPSVVNSTLAYNFRCRLLNANMHRLVLWQGNRSDITLLGLCLHCRTGVVVRRADLPRSSLHYLRSARR